MMVPLAATAVWTIPSPLRTRPGHKSNMSEPFLHFKCPSALAVHELHPPALELQLRMCPRKYSSAAHVPGWVGPASKQLSLRSRQRVYFPGKGKKTLEVSSCSVEPLSSKNASLENGQRPDLTGQTADKRQQGGWTLAAAAWAHPPMPDPTA